MIEHWLDLGGLSSTLKMDQGNRFQIFFGQYSERNSAQIAVQWTHTYFYIAE